MHAGLQHRISARSKWLLSAGLIAAVALAAVPFATGADTQPGSRPKKKAPVNLTDNVQRSAGDTGNFQASAPLHKAPAISSDNAWSAGAGGAETTETSQMEISVTIEDVMRKLNRLESELALQRTNMEFALARIRYLENRVAALEGNGDIGMPDDAQTLDHPQSIEPG